MSTHDLLVDGLIADYIRKASPKTIHQMAMEWNWDTSDHFFDFAVDNPHTDKATILMIYWMCGPRFQKQFLTIAESQKKMGSDSHFGLLEKIEHNYQNNFYLYSKFQYDPNSEDHTGTIWTDQDLNVELARDIPAVMYQKLPGEIIETNEEFDEGMPPELVELINNLKR